MNNFSNLAFRKSKVDLLNGLIGYFPFNTNALNLVDNSTFNSGSYIQSTDGKIGNCHKGAFLESYDSKYDLRNFSNGFSASGWMKINASNKRVGIFGDQASLNNQFDLGVASNSIKFTLKGTPANIQQTIIRIPPANTYFNLALTYNLGSVSFYYNGMLEQEISVSNSFVFTTFASLIISMENYNDTFIDDVCLWSRSLSPSEVLANYNRTTNLI